MTHPSVFIRTITAVSATSVWDRKSCACSAKNDNQTLVDQPGLLFIGTGSSTGCPRPTCALFFNAENPKVSPGFAKQNNLNSDYFQEMQRFCKVSSMATRLAELICIKY